MADNTKIEWTDATWTPVKGCTRKSAGCVNCYAEIMAARFSLPGQWGEGLATIVDTPQGKDHRWTGKVRLDEAELLKPLRWKKPRRIFVCSTSDLFHESVPDEWIDRVFAVMALCPHHTFQVLTKRAKRMREYLSEHCAPDLVSVDPECRFKATEAWPLPNVWLGVSVEDQARADERVPDLLATPAAVRWLSCEPLLGPLDLCKVYATKDPDGVYVHDAPILDLDWIVAGGESGPGARPMHPDWARSLRDQCEVASVPFFFKQWGEWRDRGAEQPISVRKYRSHIAYVDADTGQNKPHPNRFSDETMVRLGKTASGRLLDGFEHNETPNSQIGDIA